MKMIVSDFDGTLLDDNFEKNIIKVNEFIKKGNIFVIATGRPLDSLLDKISKYNINYSYLICNDGACIYDSKLTMLKQTSIDFETSEDIFKILNSDSNVKETFKCNGISLLSNVDDPVALYGRYIKKSKAFITLKKILKKFPNVTGYLSINWIVINDESVNKANAIKYLINKISFNDTVYTIGNGYNDISMNKEYNGFAVKKSHYKLKLVSKHQIDSLYELIKKLEK